MRGERTDLKSIVVVVLGDIGRSPRMQYHAASLASHGVRVSLVGYEGERCISAIENDPLITCYRFSPSLSGKRARWLKRRAYILFAVAKACVLMARLLHELVFRVPSPGAILVQNPPSLPSLPCVYIACLLHRCPMVIDWHNLGFTMFGRGPWHPLVWITRRAEGFLGRRARLNLTVSLAMQNWVRRAAVEGGVAVLFVCPRVVNFARKCYTVVATAASQLALSWSLRLIPERSW